MRAAASTAWAPRILHTLELSAPSNFKIFLSLQTGHHAFVLIRDAENPDAAPLAQAVVSSGFPASMKLSPRKLAGIRRIQIVAGGLEDIQIDIEHATPAARIRSAFGSVRPSLQSLIGSWPSIRGRDYAVWHHRYNRLATVEQDRLLKDFDTLRADDAVAVFIAGSDADAIDRSRSAALRSLGPLAEIQSAASLAAALDRMRPGQRFAVFIEAGTVVEPFAVPLAVDWLAAHPGTAAVYGDVEALDAAGRMRPLFSARFDPVAACEAPGAQVRGLLVLDRDVPPAAEMSRTAAAGFEAPVLAASRAGLHVAHLPAVLCLLGPRAGDGPALRPAPPVARPQSLSFVIPSRDNPDMLRRAVQSLHATTGTFDVRFTIVDHASRKAETQNCLAQLARDYPVDVVRAEGDFNFSRLMNIGRAHSNGELIFSINDDIEARQDGWLEPLVRFLQDAATGAAGPCLLFPDGRLQHAGVALGFDAVAGHPGHMQRLDDPQLPPILLRTRQVSAVTGAVLGARAAVWDAIGGWDETLAVDFNDVDFCLRVAALGLRNIYCASSVLVHHESATRGRARDSRHWPQMQKDRNTFIGKHWQALANDPWFPANLALRNKRLALADPPRRPRLADMAAWPGE